MQSLGSVNEVLSQRQKSLVMYKKKERKWVEAMETREGGLARVRHRKEGYDLQGKGNN